MVGTTDNAKLRYPQGPDAPDGPGAVYSLAVDVDNRLARQEINGAGVYVGQRATANAVEYRWNGTAWKPWSSAWAGYTTTNNGVGLSSSNCLWRYVEGEVEVRFSLTVAGAPGGRVSITMPVQAQYSSTYDLQEEVALLHAGDNDYRGKAAWKDASTVYLDTWVVVTRNGNQVLAQTALSSTTPFSWAAGDTIQGRLRYTPS